MINQNPSIPLYLFTCKQTKKINTGEWERRPGFEALQRPLSRVSDRDESQRRHPINVCE